jgi:Domain of unknown function (DUF4124)/WXXGXW repeat (2 copies)
MKIGPVVTLLCLLLWPALASAVEIYKSVDAEGHVTYSDRPTVSNAAPESLPVDEGSDVAELTAATGPPELVNDDQPPCPQEGELWTPGYWSWDGVEYYWVPGAWVSPPTVGVFWTPGYWVYVRTLFVFHRGYWGPHVGYYGGINYGFGYTGTGYHGGRWMGTVFSYNRAVNNVNANVFHHVYEEPVTRHEGQSRVSYNGGPGGTVSVATAQERLAFQSRLVSQEERLHWQPDPQPAAKPPAGTPQAEPAPKSVVSRAPPASARRTETAEAIPPRPPVNATHQRTVTAPKPPRPRPAPAIRSVLTK